MLRRACGWVLGPGQSELDRSGSAGNFTQGRKTGGADLAGDPDSAPTPTEQVDSG